VSIAGVPPPQDCAPAQHDLGEWFYISGASLIGAAVDLFAAIVAYKAVMRQIKVNADALGAQIRASAGNVRKQIAEGPGGRQQSDRGKQGGR
jgi:hypothetical protein